MTFCNRNDIDHLVLLKDSIDCDFLLEKTMAKSHLIRDTPAIDLNFHQMCFLLLQRGLADLSVGKDTDNGAVFLDAFKLAADGFGLLRVLLGVFCEGLLLRLVPVLVETSLDLVAQMFGPDGGKRSETARGLDVSNKTNHDHLSNLVLVSEMSRKCRTYRRGIDDSGSFNNFLLVHFGTRSVEVTDDGGHAGLIAHGGSQVRLLLGIILWEALDLASMATGAFSWQICQRTVTRGFEFSVRALVSRSGVLSTIDMTSNHLPVRHGCVKGCRCLMFSSVEIQISKSAELGWCAKIIGLSKRIDQRRPRSL